MISRNSVLTLSLLTSMVISPAPAVADMSSDWIQKIHTSASKTNYQGTFVYRQGDQMEVMQIAHRADQRGIQERLVSLNGWAREIIRKDDQVICYLPDKNAVMVGHGTGKSIDTKFPELRSDRADQLKSNYLVKAVKAERIAGRPTYLVSIQAKDNLRYGYRLWADESTGLLLKSDLLDNMGNTIEQFMFTNIEIGKPVPDAKLKSSYSGKGMVWHRSAKNDAAKAASTAWKVADLPPGYRLTGQMMRSVPGKPKPVVHLMVSDGLATVSVFIEKGKSGQKNTQMATSMGAAHAYRSSLDGYQVTTVGEVPAATVKRIGSSVQNP